MAQYFTPTFKQRLRVTAATTTMLTGALPFVAGLLAIQMLGDHPAGPLPALVAFGSFVLGGLLPWLTQNVMGLAGNGRLRQRLARGLKERVDLRHASFVGFSPGAEFRVWHGESDRDVGFLRMDEQRLVYEGDEYRWFLPREYIDHMEMSPPELGLQRIVIHWHLPREAPRTLTLESREAGSISRARKATQELYARLKDWYRTPRLPQADQEETVRPMAGLPPTDLSGGQIVDQPASGSCTSILALGLIMLILIWRVSGALFSWGRYYEGVLWAGLISVIGALGIGYLLHYLQAWEAQRTAGRDDGTQRQRRRG